MMRETQTHACEELLHTYHYFQEHFVIYLSCAYIYLFRLFVFCCIARMIYIYDFFIRPFFYSSMAAQTRTGSPRYPTFVTTTKPQMGCIRYNQRCRYLCASSSSSIDLPGEINGKRFFLFNLSSLPSLSSLSPFLLLVAFFYK